jgi:hypothetical protein
MPQPPTALVGRTVGGFFRWSSANVALFAGISLVVTLTWVLLGSLIEEGWRLDAAMGAGVYAWLLFGTYYVPGLILYLLLLWAFGPKVSGRATRMLSVALAPLIGGGMWVVLLAANLFDARMVLFTVGIPVA